MQDSAAKNLHRIGQIWEVARQGYLEGVYGGFDSCTQAGISMLSLREHPGYAFQQAACLHCTMHACVCFHQPSTSCSSRADQPLLAMSDTIPISQRAQITTADQNWVCTGLRCHQLALPR